MIYTVDDQYIWSQSGMKGTAGVAIAGLLGAVRAQGKPMIDFPKQKIVVAGAGRCDTHLISNEAILS